MAMLDDLLWMQPSASANPWANVSVPNSDVSAGGDMPAEEDWRKDLVGKMRKKVDAAATPRSDDQTWADLSGALGAGPMMSPGTSPGPIYPSPDASVPAIATAIRGQNIGGAPAVQFPPVPLGPVSAPAPIAAPNTAPAAPTSLAPPQATAGRNDDEDDGAKLPTSASATQGVAPLGAPAPSIWNRIGQGLTDNAPLLLALGSGLAGAPSFGEGVSRAFGNAAPIAQAQQQYNQKMAGLNATAAALLKKGASREDVVAAAQNPELMKALVGQYFGRDQYELKQTGEDAFGGKTFSMVNKFDPTDTRVWNGQQFVKPDQAAPGNAASGTPSTSGLLAPGVTAVNSSLVGDDYLKQFSPEVQAGVKAYLRGGTLPTGRQNQVQIIKRIAQKYGDDTGIPANDQTYYQRKTFTTSLGDTKSGVGLQAKGFQQGLEHMANLSDKLVKLQNWNGMGIEPVANLENWLRGLSTSQRGVVNGVGADSQAVAGEVGKLFSGQSGGGVHERQATQERLGNPTMSGPAAAGALEATMELMDGGLRPLEQRRDELFPGSEKPAGSNFRGPEQQKMIDHIRRNIAVLRGEAPQQQAAAAPVSISSKAEYDAIPRGRTYVAPDGSVRTKQ